MKRNELDVLDVNTNKKKKNTKYFIESVIIINVYLILTKNYTSDNIIIIFIKTDSFGENSVIFFLFNGFYTVGRITN